MKIIGHQKSLLELSEMILQDRLPHALLLTGPVGIGKKLVALHLAQILFCEASSSKPCGTCSSCHRVSENQYPDLHLLEPEDDLIKIDRIRELKEALSLKPYEGIFKIALILDADAMNTAASNALLKTLEEPPPNTLLVLSSSNPHRFLKTILSRCQKIQLFPLSPQDLETVLKQKNEGQTIDPSIIHYTSGSPGLALTFNNEVIAWLKQTLLPALESQPKDLLKLLAAAEEIASDEKIHRPILHLLMMEWKEKILEDPSNAQIKKFDAIRTASRALDQYANPLLTFENLFLNLCL